MSSQQATVEVTVDGRKVSVPAGTPLIEACEAAGVDVPHFCYHPDLSVAGNCRMCAVEVENARGLPISCATPVADGMVAHTDTERVKAHRAAVMEFLLINHPIDCPICDQAGECTLQKYYMDHDLQASRLEVDKVTYDKRVPVGPEVVLDQDRCVECTRCVRFCDEVPGTGELRMTNRGDRCVITTFPETPLENHYSVCAADICPVGALTQRDFRFKARVWFLQEADGICGGCARGCNIHTDYGWHPIVQDYKGRAFRVRPRRNPDVNKSWMCDFGRDEYRRVDEDRVLAARVRGEERTWEDACREAAEALTGAVRTVVVGSLDDSIEELQALKGLGEHLRAAATVAVPTRPDGVEDDILLRADKHPNRKGAGWLGLLHPRQDLLALLEQADAVVIHQADLLADDAGGEMKRALENVGLRIVVAANTSATTELATILLPGCSVIEKDGHWVNFEGRVQRFRRGRHMDVKPGAAENVAVLSALSEGFVKGSARALFADAVEGVKELGGLDWTTAGTLGVMAPLARREVEV